MAVGGAEAATGALAAANQVQSYPDGCASAVSAFFALRVALSWSWVHLKGRQT